jgi:tetratricopeptide (TPR) repeat protein
VADTRTLDRARKALDDHAWQDAYDLFVSQRERQELSAEDWERLGEAAWWSAHPDESLDAFERAFSAHTAAGNPRRAAYIAMRLAIEHADRLDTALSSGWLQRAIRLLADEPDCVEKGYLELCLVRTSFERGAVDEAIEHADRAHELGARF